MHWTYEVHIKFNLKRDLMYSSYSCTWVACKIGKTYTNRITKLVDNKFAMGTGRQHTHKIKCKLNSKVRQATQTVKLSRDYPRATSRTNMNRSIFVANDIFELTKCLFITCLCPVDRRQIYGLMLMFDRNRNFEFAICNLLLRTLFICRQLLARACKHKMAIIPLKSNQWVRASAYLFAAMLISIRANIVANRKPIYKWKWLYSGSLPSRKKPPNDAIVIKSIW